MLGYEVDTRVAAHALPRDTHTHTHTLVHTTLPLTMNHSAMVLNVPSDQLDTTYGLRTPRQPAYARGLTNPPTPVVCQPAYARGLPTRDHAHV